MGNLIAVFFLDKIARKLNFSLIVLTVVCSSWYQIGKKTCYMLKISKIFAEKNMSMLAASKCQVTWKYLFYRPEDNAKVELHGI